MDIFIFPLLIYIDASSVDHLVKNSSVDHLVKNRLSLVSQLTITKDRTDCLKMASVDYQNCLLVSYFSLTFKIYWVKWCCCNFLNFFVIKIFACYVPSGLLWLNRFVLLFGSESNVIQCAMWTYTRIYSITQGLILIWLLQLNFFFFFNDQSSSRKLMKSSNTMSQFYESSCTFALQISSFSTHTILFILINCQLISVRKFVVEALTVCI